MNRGEIWWINFGLSLGGEIKKQRPAIIISNDISNKYLNRIQVIPLTSKTDKLYPSEAYVTVKTRQHKAMADQLTTVSKKRLSNRIGRILDSELQDVERVIKIQLNLV
ncbi:MAG: type II toxin-antitoxin system PemK/MazF family toxin [Spirochaetes bacterium]|nr:type II toxin-antitoxin system PemK/MazF family toxin [Spirochaetota bacterium]